MREDLGRTALLAMILLFALTAASGQGSPLKVEIKTTPKVIPNKQLFTLDITIRNASNTEQVLQTYQCSDADWHWTTDNSTVQVKPREVAGCKKNPLVYIELKPGEACERALPIRISLPAEETKLQTVTFRIGFQPRLGYNLSTASLPYVWSDPVTISVEK